MWRANAATDRRQAAPGKAMVHASDPDRVKRAGTTPALTGSGSGGSEDRDGVVASQRHAAHPWPGSGRNGQTARRRDLHRQRHTLDDGVRDDMRWATLVLVAVIGLRAVPGIRDRGVMLVHQRAVPAGKCGRPGDGGERQQGGQQQSLDLSPGHERHAKARARTAQATPPAHARARFRRRLHHCHAIATEPSPGWHRPAPKARRGPAIGAA